jgi:FixJ family two-component response regulator
MPSDNIRRGEKYRSLKSRRDSKAGDAMPEQSELICVLDDDASVRKSIEHLLDSDMLKAHSFENAEEFLMYVSSHVVSLVVLDVWMPNTSGLKVQSRLHEVSPDTKVIVMTGRETPTIRAAALEGGAFAFLVKPFDDEAFLALVHQALGFAE